MFDVDSYSLMLAQNGAAPPIPGEAVTTDPSGAGPADGQGAARTSDPFGGQFMFIILVMVMLMIVFSLFGQRRERKKRDAMLSAIKKHDTVQTVGGVIGSIVEIKPDTVILKVDESSNIRMTFARSAIQQVLSTRGEDRRSESEAPVDAAS